MRYGAWILLLGVGFALGWLSARQWPATPAPVVMPQAVPVPVSHPPMPRVAAEFAGWLRQDAVAPVLAALDGPEQRALLPTLDRFLAQLHTEADWPRLLRWVEPLLQWDAGQRQWQDWRLDALQGLDQPRAALLAMFEAYERSLSPTRRGALQQRMEALLIDQVDRQRAVSPTRLTADAALMGLLQLAWEKQPDHAPFGLLLAEVYDAAGDWEQALYQVQLLPYSESHQARIDEYQATLEAKIARQLRANDGVPLDARNGQFVVTAVFNEAVTLQLMIDTGASLTALSTQAMALLAQAGGLHDTGHRVQVNTANGAIESPLMAVDSLQIGDWSLRDVQVLAVNLSSTEVDGLLGMNFLSQYAFSIDQEQALLFLDQP